VRAMVTDDGVGRAVILPGGGLAGLVDRLAMLGGNLRVGAGPGSGTRLIATLPR